MLNDGVELNSKEHRDRLKKGTYVYVADISSSVQRTPDKVGCKGIIATVPVHPNTWFKVKFEDGTVQTFRHSALGLAIGEPPRSLMVSPSEEDSIISDEKGVGRSNRLSSLDSSLWPGQNVVVKIGGKISGGVCVVVRVESNHDAVLVKNINNNKEYTRKADELEIVSEEEIKNISKLEQSNNDLTLDGEGEGSAEMGEGSELHDGDGDGMKEDEDSITSARDDNKRGVRRGRAPSLDETNGGDKAITAAAALWMDKRVLLRDGRVGKVIKSGSGWFTVHMDDNNEKVMKRKEDLRLHSSNPAQPRSSTSSPQPWGKALGAAKPKKSSLTETTIHHSAGFNQNSSAPSPAPTIKEIELSAIDEERAAKQSRANMMRAQMEHAERIKEFVARHQRRCFSENRPNLTVWFEEFGSDDEANDRREAELCKYAVDLFPVSKCSECKEELGYDWRYCWNMKCVASPAYDVSIVKKETNNVPAINREVLYSSVLKKKMEQAEVVKEKKISTTELLARYDSEAIINILGLEKQSVEGGLKRKREVEKDEGGIKKIRVEMAHNIEYGIRYDHATIKDVNVIPNENEFDIDLIEGETILANLEIYVTPSEVPRSMLSIIIWSICTLGLYAVYMFILHQRWHPKMVGGKRSRVCVTSRGRLMVWQSDFIGKLSPDAGGCLYTSSTGEAHTKLGFFLLSDVSSVERFHHQKGSHYTSRIRITFGAYPSQGYIRSQPQNLFLPQLLSFNESLPLLSSFFSYFPFSPLFLSRGLVLDLESCDLNLGTSINGAKDLLHSDQDTYSVMADLERVLLWGKNASNIILASPPSTPFFSVEEKDLPLIEKAANNDTSKINIHPSLLPLAPNEEIVDVLACKVGITWNHISNYTSAFVFFGVQVFEIVTLFPLPYLLYPLMFAFLFTTQDSLRQYMTLPLLISHILSSVLPGYFFMVIKAILFLVSLSLSIYALVMSTSTSSIIVLTRQRLISLTLKSKNLMIYDKRNICVHTHSFFLDGLSEGTITMGHREITSVFLTNYGEIYLNTFAPPTAHPILSLFSGIQKYNANRISSFLLKLSECKCNAVLSADIGVAINEFKLTDGNSPRFNKEEISLAFVEGAGNYDTSTLACLNQRLLISCGITPSHFKHCLLLTSHRAWILYKSSNSPICLARVFSTSNCKLSWVPLSKPDFRSWSIEGEGNVSENIVDKLIGKSLITSLTIKVGNRGGMHKVLSSLNIPTVSDNYSENVKSVDSVEITNLRRVMAVVFAHRSMDDLERGIFPLQNRVMGKTFKEASEEMDKALEFKTKPRKISLAAVVDATQRNRNFESEQDIESRRTSYDVRDYSRGDMSLNISSYVEQDRTVIMHENQRLNAYNNKQETRLHFTPNKGISLTLSSQKQREKEINSRQIVSNKENVNFGATKVRRDIIQSVNKDLDVHSRTPERVTKNRDLGKRDNFRLNNSSLMSSSSTSPTTYDEPDMECLTGDMNGAYKAAVAQAKAVGSRGYEFTSKEIERERVKMHSRNMSQKESFRIQLSNNNKTPTEKGTKGGQGHTRSRSMIERETYRMSGDI